MVADKWATCEVKRAHVEPIFGLYLLLPLCERLQLKGGGSHEG